MDAKFKVQRRHFDVETGLKWGGVGVVNVPAMEVPMRSEWIPRSRCKYNRVGLTV